MNLGKNLVAQTMTIVLSMAVVTKGVKKRLQYEACVQEQQLKVTALAWHLPVTRLINSV